MKNVMENEFDILNRRMEKNHEMRRTYLMFAFTTSIAAIAALFIVDFSNVVSWGCIVPFAIIIPFQARISYARLSHAKMEAYIYVFYPKKFKFLKRQVSDLRGKIGKFISIIVNYELFLLSVVIDLLYIIINSKIELCILVFKLESIIIIIATLIVFSLATYSFPYVKFLEKYMNEYKILRKG